MGQEINRPVQKVILCKVGGSLLGWAGFPSRLQQFLDQLDAPALLLMGGGGCADVVRQWDQVYNLGEEKSHQLAIESLSLTARLLVGLLPDAVLVCNQKQLDSAMSQKQVCVLDPKSWIDWFEPGSEIELPHHWDITSDSIALWLAAELGIDRLTLVKSVDLPPETDWKSASMSGLVDAGFPAMLQQLTDQGCSISCRWVNLRGEIDLEKRFDAEK
ncbi:MAG: hypothetical protein JKY95_15480 [Planctomycetaceae bacterium]|nr:hypothetical protein [Planctomycetaceae bacterium]